MLFAATVLALALGPAGPAPSGTASCCEAEMARAEALQEDGRLRRARREYLRVAGMQASAGEFSGHALWKAAVISVHLGNPRRAAQELDAAARAAAEFGRTNLQVQAMVEAAILYNELGRGDLALARVARVHTLVTAPEVSDDTRDMVERRIQRS